MKNLNIDVYAIDTYIKSSWEYSTRIKYLLQILTLLLIANDFLRVIFVDSSVKSIWNL